LLDEGYMLAAAQYSLPDPAACQGGQYCEHRWAVPLGVASSAAIPARIAALQPGCSIQRKLIAGADMGGLVALQIAESPAQSPSFDGALAMCTPGMGLSRWADGLIDFDTFWRVAKGERYPGTSAVNDVPWPFDWMHGAGNVVRSYVTVLVQTPHDFPLMEFQRLLSGLPNAGNHYYVLPNPQVYATAMLATQLLGDLQDQVGAPFGPLETLTGEAPDYSIDATQLAYLASLMVSCNPHDGIGCGPTDVDFEDAINLIFDEIDAAIAKPAQLSASQAARNALYKLGEVTGDLQIPALMLQGENDAATPDWSLTHYREDVAASGRSARFYGTFASGNGHCEYSPTQVLTALNALGNWTGSGIAPTAADFPAPDFDVGHVATDDPRNRVNVWIGKVTVTPGIGVRHVSAKVLRSTTASNLSLVWATGGGYMASGTIDFPAGGDQGATIALDVPDNYGQSVLLDLMQAAGPANVIMPQSVLLLPSAEYIFADGFE
jgi:hypothetical protein